MTDNAKAARNKKNFPCDHDADSGHRIYRICLPVHSRSN